MIEQYIIHVANILLSIEHYTWPFTGFVGGLSTAPIYFLYLKRHSIATILLALLPASCLLLTPTLSILVLHYGLALPAYHQVVFAAEALAGLVASFWLFRKYGIQINECYLKLFKKGYESNTDVREIHKHLPAHVGEYSPEDFFNNLEISLGLNKKRQSVAVSYDQWIKVHKDLVGTTQSGKSMVACNTLYQGIVYHQEAQFIINPKESDPWAPHVLYRACQQTGLPFYYVNLNPGNPPQLNMLRGATEREIEELFSAGFGLAEKGKESDVYRLDDRYMASEVARKAARMANPTFGDLYRQLLQEEPNLHAINKFFVGSLREMAMLETINADEGINLEAVIESGGVVYVDGSMSNARVIKAQKMLVFRIMQLAKRRRTLGTVLRPVALFLDEFKYLISNITLQALGASLSTGLHAILAHQSLNDLGSTSADLDADMVKGAVIDNTKIKLCYCQEDPETAEFYARKSGTIQVQSEVRTYEADVGLTMLEQAERRTQQVGRYLVDSNMLLNLAKGCAAVYGLGLTELIFTHYIRVTPNPDTVVPHQYGESRAYVPGAKPAKKEAECLIDVN